MSSKIEGLNLTKEEALNQIKDKYKNWQITCEYEEINV